MAASTTSSRRRPPQAWRSVTSITLGSGRTDRRPVSKAAESAEQASTKPGFQPLRLVVDSNRPVVRPIELAGYDAFLALYHDVEDAVRGNALS